ncbi:hypothetical protein [Nocardia jejuensis]|uniref:hypothetical protein n=1 Tax=Nocardia jejuensis TaxID=328049 RepID=UPI000AFD8902|nr:hypothetical protein [Nocardia jejuensis]
MPRENDAPEKDPGEPKGGRPGPADRHGEGGMATREVAADLGAEEHAQEPAD